MTEASANPVVAFLDLGTNSARLLLVRIRSHRTYAVISQQREMVRLGEGEFRENRLQPAAMLRAAQVCGSFVALARTYGARDIVAVATSATREAQNQAEFLRLLREHTGIDFHVISGREEARLIYLGIASGVHLGDATAAFIDIGGGSTEVIIGTQTQHHLLDSLKLGAIRLRMRYLPDPSRPVSAAQYGELQQAVRNAAIRTIQHVQGYALAGVYGSSGTIENLANVAARMVYGRNLQRNEAISYAQLRTAIDQLCALPLEERRKVPGLNPERADIIVSGAAIIDTLMQEMGLAEIRVSPRGLRDGLVVDYLARGEHAYLLNGESVREHSVRQLGHTCRYDEAHAHQVRRLALELFDSARASGLHALGAREREWLAYAAELHDIGTFLSYTNHHAHGYYLIHHADLLGFDQAEAAMIAAVVYYHRKALPRKKHPAFAALDAPSQAAVRVLGVLLRMAESLDRSHAGRIVHARLTAEGQQVTLALETTGDCRLELWGVQHHQEAIERTFGGKLLVTAVALPGDTNDSSAI